MTTILGIQHKNGFIMAADSQTTDRERPFIHPDVKKIIEIGNYVIAGAGTSVLADVFQGGFIPSEPSESFQGTLYQFLVSKFVPEVRQLHIECGYVPKESDGFEFLIGYKTELFYLASDYSLLRNNDTFYGIGSGYAYGIGALAAGANIKEAMKIATKFDINTGGTIQIVKRGELNA